MDRIGPGAVLAGRYRLIERLEGDPVASLWQAEDITLERRAAVRLLAAGHSHVDATLDAARRSAVIDDPRLQRVLGVGVEAGAGYVILEWVEGPTAVQLAGRVTEEEACRISFEVADALANARAKGLRHARLSPGHVRRGADGRVRISGLGIDAALIGRGIEPTREDTDVADTVALLYALISGRWPFGFVEGLLGAPYQSGKPVPLRELSTGVSSAVEELCMRTFAGEPPPTASILAAALASRLRRQATVENTAGVSGAPVASTGAMVSGAGPVVAGAMAAATGAAAASPGQFSRPVTPANGPTPEQVAPPTVQLTSDTIPPRQDDPSERTAVLTSDTIPPRQDDPSERTAVLTSDTIPPRQDDPSERTAELSPDTTPPRHDDPSERTVELSDRTAAFNDEQSTGGADHDETVGDQPLQGESDAHPAARSSTSVPEVAPEPVLAPLPARGAAASAAAASTLDSGIAAATDPSPFSAAAPAAPMAASLFTPPTDPAASPTTAPTLLPGERRVTSPSPSITDHGGTATSREGRAADKVADDTAGHIGPEPYATVELPDVPSAAVPPLGEEAAARPIPAALRQAGPTDGTAVSSSVLPQSQRRGRTVTLPDAIEGHTRLPQWRRASEAVLAGGTGRARKSGMQWSADPDDGWSLLPGEARGPEDSDWRGGRGIPTGTLLPYDDDDEPWDLAGDEYDAQRSRRRRSVVGAVVILALTALVVVGGIWAFNRADIVGGASAGASPTVTVTAGEPSALAPPPGEPPPSAPAPAVAVVGVQPLDPPPGDNSERDADAPAAIDGDPATAWTTETYNSQNFGGIKAGVGLLVSLGQPSTVTSATLTMPGTAGTFEVRSSPQPAFEGSTVVATGETSDAGPVVLTWDPVEAPYIIVWFTALPGAGSEWRGTIAEIQLA